MPSFSWYGQHLKKDGIDQGLIIPDFPVPNYAEVDYSALTSPDDITLPLSIENADLIVMTQACDIEYINEGKIKNITFCKLYPLNEYLTQSKLSNSKASQLIGNLNSGHVANMYLLDRPNLNPYEARFNDLLIVKFDESVIFPVELVAQAISSRTKMIKLLPPYREALAQAYGVFFMRVGTPQDRELAYVETYSAFM